MRNLLTIMALVILVGGIIVARSEEVKIKKTNLGESQVLSEKQEANQNEEANEIEDESDISENSIEINNKKVVTPTPTSHQELTNFDISFFKYPNSKVLSEDAKNLELETNDEDNTVTEWYKQKIKEMGMNVKTFVVTKANDKILNKLSGANSNFKVNIEITKTGNSPLRILVKIEY